MKKKSLLLVCIIIVLMTVVRFSSAPMASITGSYKILTPESPKITTYSNPKAIIDTSNSSKGYLAITYMGENPRIKVQITKSGGTTYTYDLNARNTFEVFPLSEGDGIYSVKLFENVSGSSYAQACSTSVQVTLQNEFLPFLYPNQYVNFNEGSEVIKQARALCEGTSNELQIVERIYKYIIGEISYDYNKAATVQPGYLPNVDQVLKDKSGICFDYAAVMASMLRSLEIPCKLVIGYTGDLYHAWIDVYVKEKGWVASVIYFNGMEWRMMDPTFAATGKATDSVTEYITNPKNYSAKYIY